METWKCVAWVPGMRIGLIRTPSPDRCQVCMHMDCVGVDKEPDGSLWLCDVCQLKSEGLKVKISHKLWSAAF